MINSPINSHAESTPEQNKKSRGIQTRTCKNIYNHKEKIPIVRLILKLILVTLKIIGFTCGYSL